MPGHVVCFGETLLRLNPPGASLIAQATSLDMVVGGAETNVAAGLASLGHAARMLTCFPEGPLGDKAQAAIAAAGIDTSAIIRKPGRMGLYFLENGAGLRPASVTYDRAGSVFALARPADFDFAGTLAGARLLHLSGITPALGPRGVELAEAAVAAARAANVPICFDGNYRALLWDSWDCDPRAILARLVQDATIMIGNHRDISLLLGRNFSGEGEDRRREAAEAAFAAFPNLRIIASTARHVLHAGHHRISARADCREAGFQTDEIDVTGIVDRIGTGDAFAAGLLYRWLEGAGPAEMAQAGLACAALKHALPGDMALIRPVDLESFTAGGRDVRR